MDRFDKTYKDGKKSDFMIGKQIKKKRALLFFL